MRSMRRWVQRYLGSKSGVTNWMQLNLWILWRMIVFACSQLGGVFFRDFRIIHSAGVVWPFFHKAQRMWLLSKIRKKLAGDSPHFFALKVAIFSPLKKKWWGNNIYFKNDDEAPSFSLYIQNWLHMNFLCSTK